MAGTRRRFSIAQRNKKRGPKPERVRVIAAPVTFHVSQATAGDTIFSFVAPENGTAFNFTLVTNGVGSTAEVQILFGGVLRHTMLLQSGKTFYDEKVSFNRGDTMEMILQRADAVDISLAFSWRASERVSERSEPSAKNGSEA